MTLRAEPTRPFELATREARGRETDVLLTTRERRELRGALVTPRGLIEKGSPLGLTLTRGALDPVEAANLGFRGFEPSGTIRDFSFAICVETLTQTPRALRVRTGVKDDDMV